MSGRRRGRGHVPVAAAWRQQQELAVLRGAIAQLPDASAVPQFLLHRVAAALSLGEAKGYGDDDAQIIAQHLQAALAACGGGTFPRALLHGLLFLIWQPVRELTAWSGPAERRYGMGGRDQSGSSTDNVADVRCTVDVPNVASPAVWGAGDDLAAAASLVLPTPLYAALVRSLGMELLAAEMVGWVVPLASRGGLLHSLLACQPQLALVWLAAPGAALHHAAQGDERSPAGLPVVASAAAASTTPRLGHDTECVAACVASWPLRGLETHLLEAMMAAVGTDNMTAISAASGVASARQRLYCLVALCHMTQLSCSCRFATTQVRATSSSSLAADMDHNALLRQHLGALEVCLRSSADTIAASLQPCGTLARTGAAEMLDSAAHSVLVARYLSHLLQQTVQACMQASASDFDEPGRTAVTHLVSRVALFEAQLDGVMGGLESPPGSGHGQPVTPAGACPTSSTHNVATDDQARKDDERSVSTCAAWWLQALVSPPTFGTSWSPGGSPPPRPAAAHVAGVVAHLHANPFAEATIAAAAGHGGGAGASSRHTSVPAWLQCVAQPVTLPTSRLGYCLPAACLSRMLVQPKTAAVVASAAVSSSSSSAAASLTAEVTEHLSGVAAALLLPGVAPLLQPLSRDSSGPQDACGCSGVQPYSPLRMALALLQLCDAGLDDRLQPSPAGRGDATAVTAAAAAAAAATDGEAGQMRAGCAEEVSTSGTSSTSSSAVSGASGLTANPACPVLLHMAVQAARLVAEAADQQALQISVTSGPYARLRRWLAASSVVQQAASRCLIGISNRMIQQEDGSSRVALSAADEAERRAAAASALLPLAALTPGALLRRLVTDAVQHPGQRPLVLQLIRVFKVVADQAAAETADALRPTSAVTAAAATAADAAGSPLAGHAPVLSGTARLGTVDRQSGAVQAVQQGSSDAAPAAIGVDMVTPPSPPPPPVMTLLVSTLREQLLSTSPAAQSQAARASFRLLIAALVAEGLVGGQDVLRHLVLDLLAPHRAAAAAAAAKEGQLESQVLHQVLRVAMQTLGGSKPAAQPDAHQAAAPVDAARQAAIAALLDAAPASRLVLTLARTLDGLLRGCSAASVEPPAGVHSSANAGVPPVVTGPSPTSVGGGDGACDMVGIELASSLLEHIVASYLTHVMGVAAPERVTGGTFRSVLGSTHVAELRAIVDAATQLDAARADRAADDDVGRVGGPAAGQDVPPPPLSRRTLAVLLPLLEVDLARRADGSTQRLAQLLMPASVWRLRVGPAAPAVPAATAAVLQLIDALGFASAADTHASALAEVFSNEDDNDEEVEALQQSQQAAAAAGLTTHTAATGAAAAAAAAPSQMCHHVASSMHRLLQRLASTAVVGALPAALASVLAASTSAQGRRLTRMVLPAVVAPALLRPAVDAWVQQPLGWLAGSYDTAVASGSSVAGVQLASRSSEASLASAQSFVGEAGSRGLHSSTSGEQSSMSGRVQALVAQHLSQSHGAASSHGSGQQGMVQPLVAYGFVTHMLCRACAVVAGSALPVHDGAGPCGAGSSAPAEGSILIAQRHRQQQQQQQQPQSQVVFDCCVQQLASFVQHAVTLCNSTSSAHTAAHAVSSCAGVRTGAGPQAGLGVLLPAWALAWRCWLAVLQLAGDVVQHSALDIAALQVTLLGLLDILCRPRLLLPGLSALPALSTSTHCSTPSDEAAPSALATAEAEGGHAQAPVATSPASEQREDEPGASPGSGRSCQQAAGEAHATTDQTSQVQRVAGRTHTVGETAVTGGAQDADPCAVDLQIPFSDLLRLIADTVSASLGGAAAGSSMRQVLSLAIAHIGEDHAQACGFDFTIDLPTEHAA